MSFSHNTFKEDIMAVSSFGRKSGCKISCYEELDANAGVYRQEGTHGNKLMRDYTCSRMQELGLEIKVDRVGNIFGRREGRYPSKKTIMTGSHLDSVANGGFLDGALGIFTALEALRRLDKEEYVNQHPLEIVAFTGEEGSTFGRTLLGSSVLVGETPPETALQMINADGVSLEKVLQDVGYCGSYNRGLDDVGYFVELHIEQGPVLYNAKASIGIVENISGILWLTVEIRGEENHAGTTPMGSRSDALVAAAEIVRFVRDSAASMAEQKGNSTVATVGELDVFPNQKNVIPRCVKLVIDIRDGTQKNIDTLKHKIQTHFLELEAEFGVKIYSSEMFHDPPVKLSPDVVSVINDASLKESIFSIKLNSGAVHDSQNMAKRLKTGMIFVPSVKGLSHSPLEWTDWEAIESGVKILTRTLILLDKTEDLVPGI